VLQIRGPASGERSCGMIAQLCGMISHLRIIAARLLPRNISSSDP
jgi:hypothetical protein